MSEYRRHWLVVAAAFSIFCSAAVFAAEREGKLLGAWNFDEEESLVVKDSSGNGLDGKIANPENVQRVDGKEGKALQLSGTERYKFGCALVPGMKKLNFSKGFTFEAWIRFSDQHVRKDTCYIASDGAWKGPGWRFLISYNALFIQSGDGENMWGASSNAAEHGGFENNRWYHVAATFDGSVLRVYIDGVERGMSKPDLTITKGADTLSIGSYNGGVTSVFVGTIDEVRLYDRAKSALDILMDARLG